MRFEIVARDLYILGKPFDELFSILGDLLALVLHPATVSHCPNCTTVYNGTSIIIAEWSFNYFRIEFDLISDKKMRNFSDR